MNNTIEDLLIIRAIMADVVENNKFPIEIRAQAFHFEILINKSILKLTCQHTVKNKETQRMHTQEFEIIKCRDCGEIVEIKH